MLSFRTLGVALGNLLGELVAPSGCAACDDAIARAGLFCPACVVSVEPCTDDTRSLSAFEYGGALATAIVRLKYESRADLGPRLGRAMLRAAQRVGPIDLVVPVPLHPRRLADRGYNQAALLAAPIARGMDLRFAPRALVRARDTPRQASIDDRETRLVNVAGAFVVREPSLVAGARILLIDDVRTTGATLDACSAALLGSGAAGVRSLVLARRV